MPLERPELLKAKRSDGPIHKDVIYRPLAVSVDAEMHHFISGPYPLTIVLRRNDALGRGAAAHVEWATSPPHAIAKDRYLVCPFNIHGHPVPFNRTPLNIVLIRSSVKEPAIHPIAGCFLSVV